MDEYNDHQYRHADDDDGICRVCGADTYIIGTERCNRCWRIGPFEEIYLRVKRRLRAMFSA